MSWLDNARAFIRNAMHGFEGDWKARQKHLRSIGWRFHGNTYWGRKQWGKAVREHLYQHGMPRPTPRNVFPKLPDDIIFPFRDGGDGA